MSKKTFKVVWKQLREVFNMIIRKCTQCKKIFKLDITEQQLQEAIDNEIMVQVAFPHLTVDEREILLSGLCGDCFDRLFYCDE